MGCGGNKMCCFLKVGTGCQRLASGCLDLVTLVIDMSPQVSTY